MKVKTVTRGAKSEKKYSIPTVARVIHKSETQINSFMSQTYGTTKGGLTYQQVKEAIDYDYKTRTRISWEDIDELNRKLKDDGYIFTETETGTIGEFVEDLDEEDANDTVESN